MGTEADYPFESHFLDLDGIEMHYLDEGEGAPVVMVHGNPTWSFYYRNLVLALRDTHRCIVPDHVGMGLSDKPGDQAYAYTLSRRVDDLETLLEHLGITDNVTLVVHDWGGMVGMSYAARHPDRVVRFVILNTACGHLPKTKGFPGRCGWYERRWARCWCGASMVSPRTASHVCCTRKKLAKEVRDAYCRPYDSWKNRIATLRFVQDIPLAPGDRAYDTVSRTEQSLPAFRHRPMLICWGMQDFVFSGHFLEEWERHFPEAEVHRFEDCGHYILEDADEEVIGRIRTFLGQGA